MEAKTGSHSISVLQGKTKECYITGRTGCLHKHHIYYGTGNRAISDKYGFWVWLIPELHNMSDDGIHNGNKELDQQLKEECQAAYEALGHTREEFRALIGKSYL